MVSGNVHTCALLKGGQVKCWGWNAYGQLGLGDTVSRGDMPGTMGNALPTVDLGTSVKVLSLAAGYYHTCALLEGGQVKCWGHNPEGELGLGDTEDRGNAPGQMGDALPFVNLGSGAKVVSLAANWLHTCALLDNSTMKCWGDNSHGELGLGDTQPRGQQASEMGDSLTAVDLGTSAVVVSIAAGAYHNCALLAGGRVKCWGDDEEGALGQGDTLSRGQSAGEMGDTLPFIDPGSQ
jgi:alpha-tubulin suppressor-like RCC1 family protein